MMGPVHATFLVAAPDQPGLVARLAGFFYNAGLNIVDASNHTDLYADGAPASSCASSWTSVGLSSPAGGRRPARLGDPRHAGGRLRASSATALSATWSVRLRDQIPKAAILVTKDPACLYDLVLRQRAGEIACEIPLIISNHPTLEVGGGELQDPVLLPAR